ncbi:HTH-type transcriptional regulator McbR [Pigmentiphaga humi]|uniref:HTH-type transcriptional regulator McbR n=1 Tax=Pigmentiphaga humi TaxID=2478468 RepID=A0A3P4B6I5_9BURK|nr:GntR family transcriptional regulator [Pigmentiphaga humi]VCU71136.1 HTH-type transcriptional regulator McbR [Pigmentiphaga humi]
MTTLSALGDIQPIVRASVAESVYRTLRNKLMHGEYPAGQVLGIQELANALQTSTMPVREALRQLVAQQGLEPMRSGTVRVPLITPERLEDIRRSRVLVEGTVAEWAGPHLRAAQIDELARLAEEITVARRSREGLAESLEKNRIFHYTIYQAAQSPVMLAVIDSLWLRSGAYLRAMRELLHTDAVTADRLHESTVQAFRAGDYAAARKFVETDVSWIFDRLAGTPLHEPGIPHP